MNRGNKEENKETKIKLNNIPQQKWNHLVVNYSSGHLDVFMNGVLVEARDNIPPYLEEGQILTGEKDGINGRIANVAYFNKPLSKILIDFLYNNNKENAPPQSGGVLSNLYFMANAEISIFETIRKTIANTIAYIIPANFGISWLYNYIINFPSRIRGTFGYLIDHYLYDYYRDKQILNNKHVKNIDFGSNAFYEDYKRRTTNSLS